LINKERKSLKEEEICHWILRNLEVNCIGRYRGVVGLVQRNGVNLQLGIRHIVYTEIIFHSLRLRKTLQKASNHFFSLINMKYPNQSKES